MGWQSVLSVVLLGVPIGFAACYVALALLGTSSSPLDVRVSLRAETISIATLGPGWGQTTARGTLIAATTATLTFDLPSRADVDLLFEVTATATSLPRTIPVRLETHFNDRLVGAWRPGDPSTKRMLVPRELVNFSNPVKIAFNLDNPAATVVIDQLTLRDVAVLGDLEGSVDSCKGTVVAGWAKVGAGPVPVTVRRGGRPVTTIMPDVDRPDLPAAGHPRDAGFRVALQHPLGAGESVEVVFPNGRQLKGSPCRP